MDRVSWESSRIERWELKPGDHIFAWRRSGYQHYSHHGIYESDDKVIQLTSVRVTTCLRCREANKCGGGYVVVCCLDCFLGADALCLFAYSVSSWFSNARNSSAHPRFTCTTYSESPTETVLRRANDKLVHGFGTYDLATNNCYYFAFYCKTGRYLSEPIRLPCHRCVVRVRVESPPPSPPPWRCIRSSEPAARDDVWRRSRLPESESESELIPRTNLGLASLLDPPPLSWEGSGVGATVVAHLRMWPLSSSSYNTPSVLQYKESKHSNARIKHP